MSWKQNLKTVAKAAVTIGIFVAIFAEFGGGPVAVDRAALQDGSVWMKPNPEMPGIVGKVKAKIAGKSLPEPLVPMGTEKVCRLAAETQLYAKTADGQTVPIKVLRHCENDEFTEVLESAGAPEMTPLASSSGSQVYLLKKGFQIVPMDMQDLWREIKSIDPWIFLPWFLFAMFIKLVGIFANVYRWQILLEGQDVRLGFGWLSASYFVGRYFGIVTPSTLGLDGWRLYDTARATGRPVECATALAVERLVGLVGLLVVILLFMPFANLGDRDLGELAQAMAIPFGSGVLFGLLLLLQPTWFSGLVRLMPHPKLRNFLASAIQAATAYGSRRGTMLVALACAVFGQITTMFMYFANAMALQVEGVTMVQVLYASAIMTLGTFLAPSASGEGVRELIFVALLGGRTTAAKAFLIGHLGFWIEKLPLSVPGGLLLLKAPEAYQRVSAEELAKVRASAARGAS